MTIKTLTVIAFMAASLGGCDDGGKQNEKQKRAEEALARCSDDAESKYPFSYDLQQEHTDKCMEALKVK